MCARMCVCICVRVDISVLRSERIRAHGTARALPTLSPTTHRTSFTNITTDMFHHYTQTHGLWILFTLLCFYRQIPGTCADHPLQLNPPSLVVQYGSSAFANCTTNVTHDGMGWEASQGAVDMTTNVQLLNWTVDRITEWDIKPICFINIGEEQAYQNLNVTVYKLPDQVSISTMSHTGPMDEGITYTLQCDVQNVASGRLVTVNWFKGQELVHVGHPNLSTKTPQNISSTLKISPRRGDDGVQYRCEAVLELGPEGPQPAPVVSSEILSVTVHYGPEILNCSESLELNEGESLADYCIVTGNPLPNSSWERDGIAIDPATPLNRTSSGNFTIIVNGQHKRFMEVNVIYGPEIVCKLKYTVQEGERFNPTCSVVGYPPSTIFWYKEDDLDIGFPKHMYRRDAGQYFIIARNRYYDINQTLEIDVVYPPSEIVELENEEVDAGEDVFLKCASNARPWAAYNWIYHNTSNVHITNQDGVSMLFISNAGRDNIGTYTCIASNYLGESREMVRVDVKGAKATCPLSVNPQHVVLEKGKSVNLECYSSTRDVTLSWTFSNQVFNMSTLTIDSTEFKDWTGTAACHGHFTGLDDCKKDVDISVYKRPEKVSISTFNHSGPMIENNRYTLQCEVLNVVPVRFLTVNWYNNHEKIGSSNEKMPANITTFIISPSRNNNKTSYTCEAVLNLGSETISNMSAPLNIIVHYKPVIMNKMPSPVPVFYGYPEVLVCEASGYPEPTITWIFNNNRIEGGNLTVTENGGEYTCIASNSVGNDSRMVIVDMKDVSCELVLNPPELLVEYGSSGSVDCSTKSPSNGMGWKASQGEVDMMKDVQLITWKVDSLVHWEIQPVCFLNALAGHCEMKLPVTVYKLPDRVSISTVGHTGPMIEGKQYELLCDVHNVAPVHLLTVNWYKGQHLVAKALFSDYTKTPVNQSTRFQMSLSRADDGVRYRCEAELKLSRTKNGAQASSKVASQVLGLTVHYSPQVTSVVEMFNETSEDVVLNCTVMANPPPRYTWYSTNLRREFNIDHAVLDFSTLGSGNYTCTASNGIGSVSKLFVVQAKPRGTGGSRTIFWAIVVPFVGLAMVMIFGYALVKKRTVKK